LYDIGKSYWGQIRWIGSVCVACSEYRILQANLSKLDLCELSKVRDESPVVCDAPPFLEERSLVWVE
jgi:hypothetical protein